MEDIEALQGSWDVVDLEIDGQKMSASATGGARIVIKGKRFTTLAMGATYEGTVEVDETRKPKYFDLHFTEGPEKGSTSLGIYKLSGDSWTLCLTTTGKRRPQSFATQAGSGLALETLKRSMMAAETVEAPVAEEMPAASSSGESADELGGEWEMVSCVLDGRPLEPALVKMGRRVALDNVLTVTVGGQVMVKARYAVDPALTPKLMDYTLLQGPHKGKPQHGIYELQESELTTCFAAPGSPRPGDFTSASGDGRTLTVWRQIKK